MRDHRQSRGSAVVELAVCLPIIILIVFASIEACNTIALKQMIAQSAYEGALEAFKPAATESAIVAKITTVLAARNVTPSDVSIAGMGGESFDSLERGDPVVVTVQADTNGNVAGPNFFGIASTLTSAATGVRQ